MFENLYSLGNPCKHLSKIVYDGCFEIDQLNSYAVLNFAVNTHDMLPLMALNCLKQILKRQLICLNKRLIKLEDCVIMDTF